VFKLLLPVLSIAVVAMTAAGQSDDRDRGTFPMQRADSNNDGEVSWAEVHRFAPRYSKGQFKKLDKNGDGLLSKADVRKPSEGFPEGDRLKAILRRADADKNNRVTQQELEATAPQLATRGFARLDSNKDGVITKADLDNINNREERSPQTIREADENGDGLWSYAELKTVFPRVQERAFNGADGDGDGSLDSNELEAFRRAARKQKERSTQQANVRGNAIEKILESDKNNDGEVSFEELVAAKPGFPREAFDRNDRNKDGVVTQADLS
jgi:Ca2+-binding EF-hand superfamily protein